jgi:hypothetical protein
MAENSEGDEFSMLAVVTVLIAAILVFVEGVFLLAVGSVLGSISPSVGGAVGGLGFLGVVLALVLGAMAIALYRFPDSSRVIGVVVLLVSLVSFFAGGGFFLGLILGVIGGIAAILFDPGIDDGTEVGDF